MVYKIDFLDDDDNPQHGYIEAYSEYWARLQFYEDYDYEIVVVKEYLGEIEDDSFLL